MDWFEFGLNALRRVPFEKLLFPPRDTTRELEKFAAAVGGTTTQKETPAAEEPTKDAKPAEEVPQSGSGGVVTREGVDAERMAWQDGIIRGELWLLEGHLKNNCVGCGGDVECCFKHGRNVIDAARETQSMTTDPLYQEAVKTAERVLPYVHPEDIRAGKYLSQYPTLAIEVSKVRTQFDKRVIGRAHKPVTLEEAKKTAAEEATREVERRWQSLEKR